MTRALALAIALCAAGPAVCQGKSPIKGFPLSYYEVDMHRLIEANVWTFSTMRECLDAADRVPLNNPGIYGVCP